MSKTILVDAPSGKRPRFKSGRLYPAHFYLPLVVAALAGLIAGGLLLVQPFVLNFGADDHADLLYLNTEWGGFFGPEKQQGEEARTYRWASQYSYVNLGWPLVAMPRKATLVVTAPRPNRPPDEAGTNLTIFKLNGEKQSEVGKFAVSGTIEDNSLTFRLPPQLTPTLDRPRLRLEASDNFQPGKGDTRRLSLIFFSLKLEPDLSAFGWRGWLAWLEYSGLVALLTLSVWGISGGFRSSSGWRLGLEIGAGAVLVVALLTASPALQPFLTPVGLVLLAGWFLFWLADRFSRAAPELPAPFIYAAILLPLMPVIQLAAGRIDFTKGINNLGLVSLAVYGSALLVCAFSLWWKPGRFKTVFLWSFLGAAALLYVYSHWQIYLQDPYRGADFRNNYIGLLNFENKHLPLYDVKDILARPGQAVRMPPLIAVLFWPLLRIFGTNMDGALLGWRVFNELLVIPALFGLWWLFGRARPYMGAAVLFCGLSFGQIAENISYGQFNLILLAGLLLTAIAVKRTTGRDSLVPGLALALPVCLKLLPGVVAAFFLFERRWRSILGLVVGGLLWSAAIVAAVGWNTLWFFFTEAMWNVNAPELGIGNQSWWGFIGRVSVSEVHREFAHDYPTGLTWLGYAGAIVGVGLTLLVGWRRSRKADWLNQQLVLSALTLVMLWVPPFGWMHYVVCGLVAICALLTALSQPERRVSQWQLAVFGLSYALLAYGGRNEFFDFEAMGLALWGSSYRFYAILALWALNLWLLGRPQTVNATQAEKSGEDIKAQPAPAQA